MTKQWNEYREVIIRQYKHQNKPLHEVQRMMEEKYGFKASTRAYRSRFDRWKVYKYSCRKRRDSIGGSEKEFNSEDCLSPSSLSLGSPVMTSADRPPSTVGAESTSPEISGSPITKFEPRSRYAGITASFHSIASLPSPPGLAHDHHHPFRFHRHFGQQYYLGSSQVPNETGGGEGEAPTEYYHVGHERDHDNLYDADQSPTPSPAEHLRGISLDELPIAQNGFSQIHSPSPTTMAYNYPITFLKASRD